ncbi:class I SAM-dependent methyltransferase [Rhodoflexus caldus]|uniref:class I SAM-dependent methyltransferase n=1 Tax=Rhodoflexus caldus TaxID=2891236 RepID=UPI002029F173|nr:class I SAM-dependent methyltransferase [Rhodoflexus caldus]
MLYLKELRWGTVTELMEMHRKGVPFADWGIKGHNRPFILENCQLKPGMKVVEIGGAYSDLPQHIATQFGCEVHVIDDFGVESGEAEMWSRWGERETLLQRNPDVRYIFDRAGNFASTQIPLNYYDLIFTVSTLEHVPAEAMADVFRHMEQMLKPGGTMVHCIDLQIPLKLHKTKDLKGLLAGTLGYYLYFAFANRLASAQKPQLKTLNGWKAFLKKVFGSQIDTSGVKPEGALMSSLNTDIVTEPMEIVYKYYPPKDEPKLYRRNGTFVLIIEKR